ncbi:MAG: SLBB domain-containing protein [Candidatus Sulfotelmatobacter sp.]
MQKLPVFVLCVLFLSTVSFSQSYDNVPSSQSSQSLGIAIDCSDPSQAGSVECSGAQSQQNQRTNVEGGSYPSQGTPQLRTVPGLDTGLNPQVTPLNPSEIQQRKQLLLRPETEFEQMVADTVGRPLPLFGQSLFIGPPSTFAPFNLLSVPSDYIIGPGDELQVRTWGQVQANLRVIVDRSGQIYIPQVGQVSVAGVHYGDLEQHLKDEISKIFKNFNVSANVGRLRSIQVLVVGNARYPGTYTIGALSTLVNAIFASGGPTPQGSLRHIQVKRDGATITDFDFYDLLIKGDKSKDVRLLSGDVLYIPPVGPLVGISGSVNSPAIYEIKDNSNLNDLIEIAGGLSTIADTSKITVDRLVDHEARKTLEFPYDEQSEAFQLKNGDIIRVFSIVSRFEDTVTLRGNVANPGRYPWKPGMRVTDLIPNAQAMLTRRYWMDRAAIVNGRATEYPVRARNPRCGSNRQPNSGTSPNGAAPNGTTPNSATPPGGISNGTMPNGSINPDVPDLTGNYSYGENQSDSTDFGPCIPSDQNYSEKAQDQSVAQSNNQTSGTQQRSATDVDTTLYPNHVKNIAEDIRRYAPEINWDYAIIQRVNPQDLTSKLLWINPRKAILEHDEASNLELQPGDIVTIFSQKDISVPQAERSRYVVIEGEVVRPGVYKLEANEGLHSVLERAGGITPNAYIYGSQLTRESARIEQQKSLDELARSMEVQVRQSTVAIAATSTTDVAQLQAAQEGILTQLRSARASGRVALPVTPSSRSVSDFPDVEMEDGDRLIIPHTPATVSVVGNVYSPGSFIFNSRNTAGAYLEMAGKGKPQSDLHHAFVLRANGVVVAANNVNGAFTGNKFDRMRLYAGDEIIVPFKVPTGAFIRGLQTWSQIASQLAITAAALAVVHP